MGPTMAGFERREFGERPVPILRLLLIAAVGLAVHSTLFYRLRLAGIGPDVFLVLATLGGLELGVAGGAALGVLTGLAADMTTHLPVGLWAFVGGLIGFAMGLVRERAFTGTLQRPPLLLVFVSVLFGTSLYPALALVVSDVSLPSPLRLFKMVLIPSLWSLALVLPLRRFVRLIMGTSS